MELSERIRKWGRGLPGAAKFADEVVQLETEVEATNAALEINDNCISGVEDTLEKCEAENEGYKDALYSIAGTNTKPFHLQRDWKEMMLVAKQRAKEALGCES